VDVVPPLAMAPPLPGGTCAPPLPDDPCEPPLPPLALPPLPELPPEAPDCPEPELQAPRPSTAAATSHDAVNHSSRGRFDGM